METVLILCVILAVVLFLVGAAMWYVKKHKAKQHTVCEADGSDCESFDKRMVNAEKAARIV